MLSYTHDNGLEIEYYGHIDSETGEVCYYDCEFEKSGNDFSVSLPSGDFSSNDGPYEGDVNYYSSNELLAIVGFMKFVICGE